MSSREERLASNEDLFRQVNERIVELTDKWGGQLDVICECANPECAERLALTLREYEQLRQNPHHFAVLDGHQILDVEDVVERNDRYLVVEKHVETHEQVEQTDPSLVIPRGSATGMVRVRQWHNCARTSSGGS